MPLVFAYGSNLHWDQMVDRCPSARVVGAAALMGYRLAFVGYSRKWRGSVATVIESGENLVAGMVYRISREDLRALDGFEGAPRHYTREPCMVRMLGTEDDLEVDTYFLDRDYGAPSIAYVETIRRGFKKWGFDPRWLSNAIRFSKRRADAAAKRRAKQARDHAEELRSRLRDAAGIAAKYDLHDPTLLLEPDPGTISFGHAFNHELREAARESRSTGNPWFARFVLPGDRARHTKAPSGRRKARKR